MDYDFTLDEINLNDEINAVVQVTGFSETNKFKESSYFKRLVANLKEIYGLTWDDFKLYFYAGGDTGKHKEYFLTKMGGIGKPGEAQRCVCGQIIVENCYVTRTAKDIIVIMGNCCIKRYIPTGMSKTCEICAKPHKNRKDDICKKCRKEIKDKNKLEKQIIKQRRFHGVHIKYDDYKPLPVYKYELSNRDRRWYNELQDIKDSDNEYVYDEYLKEYQTINKVTDIVKPLTMLEEFDLDIRNKYKCKCSYEDTELFHYTNTCFYERVITPNLKSLIIIKDVKERLHNQ